MRRVPSYLLPESTWRRSPWSQRVGQPRSIAEAQEPAKHKTAWKPWTSRTEVQRHPRRSQAELAAAVQSDKTTLTETTHTGCGCCAREGYSAYFHQDLSVEGASSGEVNVFSGPIE
jgi:hypothetical protein